ncbi:MAG: hypothetical protein Aureis2KO_12390 [Aureisphaera sp.]
MATGGEAIGSGGTISYSVGQIDYSQTEGSGGTISQGLQQPFEIFVLGTDEHPNIQIEMAVYPNPTRSNLTLRLNSIPLDGIRITLFDLLGRSLYEHTVISEETIIPMETLTSSTYLLMVRDDKSLLKTFKIIKN